MCVPERTSVMVDKPILSGMHKSDLNQRATPNLTKNATVHESTPVGYRLVYDVPVSALTAYGNLSRVSRNKVANIHLVGALMTLLKVLHDPSGCYGSTTIKPNNASSPEFSSGMHEGDLVSDEKVLAYWQLLLDKDKRNVVGYRFMFFIQDPHINVALGIDNELYSRQHMPPLTECNIWDYAASLGSRRKWVTQTAAAIRPDCGSLVGWANIPLNGVPPLGHAQEPAKGRGRKRGRVPAVSISAPQRVRGPGKRRKSAFFGRSVFDSDDEDGDADGEHDGLDDDEDRENANPNPNAAAQAAQAAAAARSEPSAVRFGKLHPASPYALFDPKYAIETRARQIMPTIHDDYCTMDSYQEFDPQHNNDVSYKFPFPETVRKLHWMEVDPLAICLLRVPEVLTVDEQDAWKNKYEGTEATSEEHASNNTLQMERGTKLSVAVGMLAAGKNPNPKAATNDIPDEFAPLREKIKAWMDQHQKDREGWMQTSGVVDLILKAMSDSNISAHQAYAEFLSTFDEEKMNAVRIETLSDPHVNLFGNLLQDFMTHMEEQGVTFLHMPILTAMWSAFTASNPAFSIKSNQLYAGGPATGKSWILHVVEELRVPGTTYKLESITLKTFHTTNGYVYTLKLCLADEMPAIILGTKQDGKPDGPGDEAIKAILVNGELNFSFLNIKKDDMADRKQENVTNDVRIVLLGCTNVPAHNIADPMFSRLCVRQVNHYQRDGHMKADVDTRKRWFPKPSSGWDRFKGRCQWAQALVHLVYTLIDVGFLREVDLSVADVCYERMISGLKAKGLLHTYEPRRLDSLKEMTTAAVIWYAVHAVFFVRDPTERVALADICKVEDFLFCTEKMAIAIFQSVMDYFVEPMDTYALIK